MRLSGAWFVGFMLLGGMSAPACADVLEIDDRGSVHSRSGSGAVQSIDATGASIGDAGAVAFPEAAVTPVSEPHVPETLRASFRVAAARYAISPDLLAALVWRESGWQAQAVSPKGAIGLAQLMPATARALAVDARDPAANLAGGAHYLRTMLDRFDGDVERALAAYNAGPGRVTRTAGLPRIAETQSYVSTILDRLSPAPTPELAP